MQESLAKEVTVRIPAPLYLLNGATIPIDTPEGRYTIGISVVEREGGSIRPVGGAQVTVPGDPYGALHNTLVTARFPRPQSLAYTPPAFSPAQVITAGLVNHLLDEYRVRTINPAIRRIRPAEAGWLTYVTPDGRTGELTRASALPPRGEAANVAPGQPELINDLCAQSGGHQPSYRILHMDAMAGWVTLDKRAALAYLYMSFEMVAWLAYEALITSKFGSERYAAEYGFNDDTQKPTIRQVLKTVNDWHPSGHSLTQLNRKFDRFWRYRNDVLHGRTIEPPWPEIEELFGLFEELAVQWLDPALTAGGGPSSTARYAPGTSGGSE